MSPIFVQSLRALLSGRRWVVAVALDALVMLVVIIVAAAGESGRDEQHLVNLFSNVVLPIVLPLIAVLFATEALGAEVEDGTLIYLTLRPQPGGSIVAQKFAAAALVTVVAVWIVSLGAFLVLTHGTAGGAMLVALLAAGGFGALAYTALFLLIGLLVRRALLVGILYVLLWEGTIAGLSTAAAHLSVRYYAFGIFAGILNRDALIDPATAGPPAGGSILFLLAVAAVAVALTARRLRRIELR
jgi:ABC-2 type transport system permease protein